VVSGHNFKRMEPAVRLVRVIQVAMLVSVVVYVAVGELAGRSAAPPNALFYTLSLVSISTLGVAFVVRRTLVLPAEALLREKPGDLLIQARWRSGYIFLYALCEALTLFGLILRMAGFTLAHVWGFYLGGFLLLMLFSPRLPSRSCADTGRGDLAGRAGTPGSPSAR
jgi:hypothetical protein